MKDKVSSIVYELYLGGPLYMTFLSLDQITHVRYYVISNMFRTLIKTDFRIDVIVLKSNHICFNDILAYYFADFT